MAAAEAAKKVQVEAVAEETRRAEVEAHEAALKAQAAALEAAQTADAEVRRVMYGVRGLGIYRSSSPVKTLDRKRPASKLVTGRV